MTTSAGTARTIVNMSVVDAWNLVHTFDDVRQWARDYWCRSPAAHEIAEVLVGGPLYIERLVRDLRHDTPT